MRNPARIDEILSALRAAWEESPDLRLGQLIVNAVRPTNPCPEVFYARDEDLVRRLMDYRAMVRAAKQNADSGRS
ncbi:hypothetical protein SAMN05428960_1292 [Mitsuaria sp. PDC51]|uniref:hypothetical protein n=1 Tax=Mitsuaria sp. PDC51 TaxID=1881035 RepID=UPI0008EF0F41|nr:hypothetical protein [Mitsuaria sp. PDC51]SFR76483.1 hypothetical protein SAMN05428960_1292 [Mitsuaria sp. PDC51]